MPKPFDLETALALWRRRYETDRRFLPDDIRELEQHVRDAVAARVEIGEDARAAFLDVMREVGEHEDVRAAYHEVRWGKVRRQKGIRDELGWRMAMLKNYVTTAVRSLLRQKGYAFLNMFGLAVGLACFVLILLFVQHELSYDRFHERGDRIYRMFQERPTSTGSVFWTHTSPAMADAVEREFPEVVSATTVGVTYNPLLSVDGRHFEADGLLADEQFLSIFSFSLLHGDPETALADVGSIVLTASLARTLFGDEDPMGRTLLYQNQTPHVVTGILADIPETSHLQFEYLLPARTHDWYGDGLDRPIWYNNGWYTYVVLAEGAETDALEAKMKALIDEGLSDWRPEDRMRFGFQPLADVHLYSGHMSTFDFERSGDVKYVLLFLTIGLVILLLACVNYTNLAVARSIKRAREVGMRKVVGAGRGQLLGQFLGESVLMTTFALGLALGLVHLLLPLFGGLVERPIHVAYFENGLLVPGLLALVLLVGLVAGSYPAVFMASLRPIQALAGKRSGRRFRMQRALIVGQYAVSIVLVAGSFVVREQMRFMQERDLGYDREHVLTVYADDRAIAENYDVIRETWLRDPRVETVTYSRHLPTNVGNTQGMFRWEGSSDGERLPTQTTSVDHDFLDAYGIELVAGRGFSREYGTDTLGANVVLVNEATVRALGWTPEEAVGKQFDYTDDKAGTLRTIVGVMKDFHFNSIHSELGPLVLTLDRNPTGFISVRVRSDDLPGTIALFEETVERFSPYPFTYEFLDDSFGRLYHREARLGELFGFFTFLALLIASLGLFGLAAYAAEQRTKEIGVRKVLGASVSGVVTLLSKDFLKLVGVAFLLAAPAAYVLMQRWLEDFTYRIDPGPGLFLLAGGLALAIAFLTVAGQAVRAATADPVETLRYE